MTDTNLEDGSRRQQLEVEFELAPSDGCSCLPEEFVGRIVDFEHVNVGDSHHADISVAPSESAHRKESGGCIVHRRSDIEDDCPFRAFYLEGWIPRVVNVTGDTIQLRTYLPDREALTALVDALKQRTTDLEIKRLTRIELDEDCAQQNTTRLELTELTETQRQTAITAVNAGYYDSPRGTSLGAIADELGISKAALSRRLNTVEAKIMKTAFDRMSAPRVN